MRAFLIACVAFLLLVALLFGSSVWLTHRAEALYDAAKRLSSLSEEEREAAIRTFAERWEGERFFFVIFIHKEELVPLESALTRAEAAAKIKSDSDYQIAVAEVLANLAQLKRQVGVHFEGIF